MLINIVNISNNIDGRYFSNKDFGKNQYAKNFLKYIKKMSETEGQETNKEIGQTTEKKYTQLYEKLVKRQGKLTKVSKHRG
jgi:translation initiation factor 2 alpha subunit (eIF-2alpha)